MTEFDLLVIGGGPGGYVAAIRAGQLGLRTALVEKDQLGGTCLNRGCVPTKALLHAAAFYRDSLSWAEWGLSGVRPDYDFAAMHNRKTQVVENLRQGIASLLKGNKVEVITGEAKVIAPHKVIVDGVEYTAKDIIIATGSRPLIPDIPGIDLPGVVTSDDLLNRELLFKRLLIVGGGVISMEFATMYQALGCEVTIVVSPDRILPFWDREISQSLAMLMKKRGIKIFTATRLTAIEQGDGELICQLKSKKDDTTDSIAADGVLLAIGRQCCAEQVFAADLEIDTEYGQIVTDSCFCTSQPHIYAIGDIIKGSFQLAHAASANGVNAVCHIAGKEPEKDMNVIPRCVFSNPEIASVGITADEAKEQGIEVTVGKYLVSGNARSMIAGTERGFVKLVTEKASGKILGAQLMCCNATDMVNELALAITQGLTARDIDRVIHPHPTFVEGIAEAAEEVLGHGIHTMPRRR